MFKYKFTYFTFLFSVLIIFFSVIPIQIRIVKSFNFFRPDKILHFITYFLASLLTRLKYISLINILSKKKVVTELVQHDFNVPNIERELLRILKEENRKEILTDYQNIISTMGPSGCFKNIAKVIYSDLLGIISNTASK